MTKNEQSQILDYTHFGEQLAEIEWNVYTIRGIFLLLTRMQYSSSDHFGELKTKLENFIWHPDKEQRKLHIDYDYNFDAKAMSLRPAIYVGTDDLIFHRKVVDNSKGVKQSNDEYIKLGSTNVIIRHVSGKPDEALQLASLSSRFFLALTKMMQEQAKLYTYEVGAIRTSRPFEASNNSADPNFAADLLINIQFSVPWLIIRESHRIRTFSLEMKSELEPVT